MHSHHSLWSASYDDRDTHKIYFNIRVHTGGREVRHRRAKTVLQWRSLINKYHHKQNNQYNGYETHRHQNNVHKHLQQTIPDKVMGGTELNTQHVRMELKPGVW